ncbi:hydrogenase large subunit [Thermococcus barophilus]|uniref:Membrane bound [NiFe]-hydrogenase MBH2, subunit Mbh2L (Catalytic subunit) n=1 Tax=Thermococcus barophilus TaxID=55802 RepID=A0A0S1XD02_THEBA|nr:nickel-dependent hydrogenase large subunit [Thermococcus barophilus]ALM75647.1 Membrane bound [NiFe]-hydrogenase MBH2, subunit Mbh2L (catalytic subunit) [Thermococcus barophilus]
MNEKIEYWVKIPIGPIHPALEEPEKFIITLDGERIINVDVKLGYNLRGLEWIAMRRNWIQVLYLAERICGICSFSHNHTYARAVEEMAGIELPERAEYIRVIIGELERIHSHLLNLGVVAHTIGYDTVLHLSWLARERVMDILEDIGGNRVNYAGNMIGGVRRDIKDRHKRAILEMIQYYRQEVMPKVEEIFLYDPTVEARLRDSGVIPKRVAIEYSAQGPTARGSGIRKDVRYNEKLGVYPDLGVKPVTPKEFTGVVKGDVFDRMVVRVGEIWNSMEIIERALDQMPEGKIKAFPKDNLILVKLKKAEGEGIGRYEAPRGELIHYVRAEKGKDGPAKWKMREPTFPNLFAVARALVGEQLADVPVAIASIDPCLSCTDRVAVIDANTGKRKILTEVDLLKESIKKTKEINPNIKARPERIGIGRCML